MSKGDSGTGGTGAPSGSCADPIVVSLGTTVRGTTCGGTHFGDSICQARLNPDVFLYVDAAAGTALRLDSSYGVSLMAFTACDPNAVTECSFGSPQATDGGTFEPMSTSVRLFGVEREDTECGEFAVTVTGL